MLYCTGCMRNLFYDGIFFYFSSNLLQRLEKLQSLEVNLLIGPTVLKLECVLIDETSKSTDVDKRYLT